MNETTFKTGQPARIRHSFHSPYPGRVGTIVEVDSSEPKRPYLVSFSDGLQFRYSLKEIEPLDAVHPINVIEVVHRVIYHGRDDHSKSV